MAVAEWWRWSVGGERWHPQVWRVKGYENKLMLAKQCLEDDANELVKHIFFNSLRTVSEILNR